MMRMPIFLRITICIALLLGFSCKSTPDVENVTSTLAADILWASPNGFDLTMDIYTPNTGRDSYPVIVMFHGGGWLINNKSIMKSASEYLSSNGEYVVCNVNYRLLGDLENSVKMNEIVEDALGAVLWVKEHIGQYKGDSSKITVTGDSAGGHLAMMVLLQGLNLRSEGFVGDTLGFNPSYLPTGKSAEQIVAENGLTVQSAILSYGAFDLYTAAQNGFEESGNIFWGLGGASPRGIFGDDKNVNSHPELYQQVSPAYVISDTSEQILPPMLFTVGSKDDLTTPASIEAFMEKLKEKGHTNMEYWMNEGRPHAFLDSGSNLLLGINFRDDAIPALDKMLAYLNGIFY